MLESKGEVREDHPADRSKLLVRSKVVTMMEEVTIYSDLTLGVRGGDS